MKRLITAACAALLLSACASTPPQPSERTLTIDGNYVYTVEKHARRMGVRVQWVNPPYLQRTAAPAPTRHTFRPGGDAEDEDATQ